MSQFVTSQLPYCTDHLLILLLEEPTHARLEVHCGDDKDKEVITASTAVPVSSFFELQINVPFQVWICHLLSLTFVMVFILHHYFVLFRLCFCWRHFCNSYKAIFCYYKRSHSCVARIVYGNTFDLWQAHFHHFLTQGSELNIVLFLYLEDNIKNVLYKGQPYFFKLVDASRKRW